MKQMNETTNEAIGQRQVVVTKANKLRGQLATMAITVCRVIEREEESDDQALLVALGEALLSCQEIIEAVIEE